MRHLAFIAALLAAVACAQAALAHAFLESASPKVGGRVAGASDVRLTFSEPVEAAFSTITVSGPPGFAGAAPAKPTGQDGRTLAAAFKAPLPGGQYLVRWRVLSRDSHVTQGTFRFEVGR